MQTAPDASREDAGVLDPSVTPITARLVAQLAPERPAREPYLPLDANQTPAGELIIRDAARPSQFGYDWLTNFGIRTVPLEEFSPRLLRDAIRSLDDPAYIDVAAADAIYTDGSPMVFLDVGGDVRAYPLEILLRHEIVNAVVGGIPVLVTYCPLCNTAITFDRRVDAVAFEFGASGLLRRSDLVMYDR